MADWPTSPVPCVSIEGELWIVTLIWPYKIEKNEMPIVVGLGDPKSHPPRPAAESRHEGIPVRLRSQWDRHATGRAQASGFACRLPWLQASGAFSPARFRMVDERSKGPYLRMSVSTVMTRDPLPANLQGDCLPFDDGASEIGVAFP